MRSVNRGSTPLLMVSIAAMGGLLAGGLELCCSNSFFCLLFVAENNKISSDNSM